MRRNIGLAILAAATAAAAAAGIDPVLAQGKGDGPREGRFVERGKELADYLDLTAEQRDQWRTLASEHRQAMKPLFEEGQKLRENVKKLMDGGASDAEVGAAMKAARDHRDQVRAASEEFDGRLTSVLTEEQKTKYEAFKAARRTERDGRRERGPRRPGRPGGDAGDGADDPDAPQS